MIWPEQQYGHMKPDALKGWGLAFKRLSTSCPLLAILVFTPAPWNGIAAKNTDSGLQVDLAYPVTGCFPPHASPCSVSRHLSCIAMIIEPTLFVRIKGDN